MEPQKKQEIVSALKDKLNSYSCAIVADYHGMDVASLQKLRREISRTGLELQVVKNTLLTKAAAEFDYSEALLPYLKGMTAVAWSHEDPSAPARVMRDFSKENNKLKIKCGILDGKVLNPDEVTSLAALPGKEQIMAGFLALLTAPAQQFLSLMQAPLTNLLSLLQNYKEKKEGVA